MSSSLATARCSTGRNVQRDRLIAAARTAFTAHGYHGTTMDTVSAVADVAKPVLYRYFSTKSELYLAVILDYLDELTDRLRVARDTATSDFDRVRHTVGILFDSRPHSTPELVFGSGIIGDHTIDTRIATGTAEFVAGLATHLHPAGRVRHRHRLLAYGLIGATLAAAGEWHRQGQPIAEQSAVETIARWYCSGVREG
ncbi:MAG: TetR/AcrR family transcriptional regulator [Nocardia sp.]|nr:TetR/AcrR family transcriptional regulator [Nocardia sp.]